MKRSLRARMPDLKERFAALTRDIEAQVAAIENERARDLADPRRPFRRTRIAERSDHRTHQAARHRRRAACSIKNASPAGTTNWLPTSPTTTTSKTASQARLDKYFSISVQLRPQIYGLYWSKPQMEARQSEELAKARRWLNRLWDVNQGNQDGKPVFNPDQEYLTPTASASAEPGDASLGLSPHRRRRLDRTLDRPWLRQGSRRRVRRRYRVPQPAQCRAPHRNAGDPVAGGVQHVPHLQAWTALTAGPGDGTLNVVPIAKLDGLDVCARCRTTSPRTIQVAPARSRNGHLGRTPRALLMRQLRDPARRTGRHGVVASGPDPRRRGQAQRYRLQQRHVHRRRADAEEPRLPAQTARCV